MNNRRKPDEYNISPRVERIFKFIHYFFPKELTDLNPTDLREFKKIASGEIPSMSRSNRAKAFMVLSQLGGAEECRILGKVVADDEEETELRAIAATNLSFLPAKHAEPELITNLKIEEDLVRLKIIKSLGRVGSKTALDALDRILDVEPEFVRKQLRFAKALISYRLGLDREDLPFVEGAKREPAPEKELIELTVKQTGPEAVKHCLQKLVGTSYGIHVAEDYGFEVRAGKAKWMLLLNKESAEGNILSSLTRQKMLCGLLTRWTKESGSYAVEYVVLTNPHDFSVDIMVVRTDGEIFYSGRARVKDGVVTFSVSDIERAGTAPTQVAGQLTPGGVEFTVCIPFGRRQNKRTTMDLKRPG